MHHLYSRLRRLSAAALLLGVLLLALAGCAAPQAPVQDGPAQPGPAVLDAAATAQAQAAPAPLATKPRATAAATATRQPRATATPDDGLRTVSEEDLPREARTTIRLIRAGGPFPFDKDGSTFQNRERLLPGKPRGYYREYTVITPGENDRGARRIVAGDGGELYYTDDHYDSFRRVAP